MPDKLLFLPGTSGNTKFWQPVADRLTTPAERLHFGWPGFGPTPADPAINSIEDLIAMVLDRIDAPSALIAQSMGGVIAMQCALRKPAMVTHLVLTATSGGLDLNKLGAEDWRESFHAQNPSFPRWFANYQEDLTGEFSKIVRPVLLLWGDADRISPPLVGERLSELLPSAELHVIKGGAHDLANTHADQVAPLIEAYLNHGNLAKRP